MCQHLDMSYVLTLRIYICRFLEKNMTSNGLVAHTYVLILFINYCKNTRVTLQIYKYNCIHMYREHVYPLQKLYPLLHNLKRKT